MPSKVPEKVFVKAFLDNLQSPEVVASWSTRKDEDGNTVLDTTTHNTALVMRALRNAAKEAGYISLMFALISCKTDALGESNQEEGR